MDNKELCINLSKAETEKEVVDLLNQAGHWNDTKAWCFYGGYEGNYSDIGNQQTKPECALVEKLINSVDASLMRECWKNGIQPDSQFAPNSISEAVEKFFHILKGNLVNIDATTRTKLAENICMVATGSKSRPCYSIVDRGEGQTPNDMPSTFLSLPDKSNSNKLKISFVQGKFNMGGTGALRFSSEMHNLQLIITRKDPLIAQKIKNDPTIGKWGFTIVRRENPGQRRKNSSYTYLAPKGKILNFDSSSLPLLPGKYPNAYGRDLEWGSFIKLYEYRVTGGLKAPLHLDFYNRLSLLIPNLALPIRLYERREGYSAHSYEATLSGLSVRLEEDKRENLEPNFPNSATIIASGQKMSISIYAFKKGADEKYRKDEGIVFLMNGQTQGRLTTDFFTRQSVGLHYIANSLLVLIDCSNFDGRAREDLFMNNREQLSDGEFRREIEVQLEELLKHHQGLRELKDRRRREEIQTKLEDSKPLADVLKDIIKKSPALASLFTLGNKIPNPFSVLTTKGIGAFIGKKHPTFFTLMNDNGHTYQKHCPINRRFRVQFKTDVENEYFVRDNSPGDFSFEMNGIKTNNYLINLWNGTANLTAHLPDNVKVDELINCRAIINDESLIKPFINEFSVLVEKKIKSQQSKNGGERKKSPGDNEGKTEVQSSLALPQVKEVRRENWEQHKFDKFSSIEVKGVGTDEGYDFFVNVDNIYLLSEIKLQKSMDPKLLEGQYKYGIVLIALGLLKEYQNIEKGENGKEDSSNNEINKYDVIQKTCRALSPILLPMISFLGELELEEAV
ncbi:MAG: hypothetical protein ABSA44_01560 [Bacteroidota bacterium]|jgi:hypothetical protein